MGRAGRERKSAFFFKVRTRAAMSRRKAKTFVVSAVAAIGFGFFTVAGLHAAAGTVAPAGGGHEAVAATVGDFAVQLASALQLPGPRGGFSSESASLALWKAGLKVHPDSRKPLTEADITAVFAQMGFNLTSEDPGRAVTAERSMTIIGTFVSPGGMRSMLSAANGGDDFNNGNGKGGKFKRKGPKSPSADPYAD